MPIIFATLFLVVVAGCSQGIHIKKQVTFTSPALHAVDVCRGGLCVLPLWNARTDSLISEPSTKEIEKVIKQAGHRQLELIPYHKQAGNMVKRTGDPYLFLQFEKKMFSNQPFDAPSQFWKSLKAGYFLRISVQQGEIVKTFSREKKYTMVLVGRILSISSRQIVWEGNTVCSGTLSKDVKTIDILQAGIASFVELLPVSPKVGYISPMHENW